MQEASRFEGWEACEVDGGSQSGSYLQALRYVEPRHVTDRAV